MSLTHEKLQKAATEKQKGERSASSAKEERMRRMKEAKQRAMERMKKAQAKAFEAFEFDEEDEVEDESADSGPGQRRSPIANSPCRKAYLPLCREPCGRHRPPVREELRRSRGWHFLDTFSRVAGGSLPPEHARWLPSAGPPRREALRLTLAIDSPADPLTELNVGADQGNDDDDDDDDDMDAEEDAGEDEWGEAMATDDDAAAFDFGTQLLEAVGQEQGNEGGIVQEIRNVLMRLRSASESSRDGESGPAAANGPSMLQDCWKLPLLTDANDGNKEPLPVAPPRPIVHFCGHCMHGSCLDDYLSSLMSSASRRAALLQIDASAYEFLCPECRTVSNFSIPFEGEQLQQMADVSASTDDGTIASWLSNDTFECTRRRVAGWLSGDNSILDVHLNAVPTPARNVISNADLHNTQTRIRTANESACTKPSSRLGGDKWDESVQDLFAGWDVLAYSVSAAALGSSYSSNALLEHAAKRDVLPPLPWVAMLHAVRESISCLISSEIVSLKILAPLQRLLTNGRADGSGDDGTLSAAAWLLEGNIEACPGDPSMSLYPFAVAGDLLYAR